MRRVDRCIENVASIGGIINRINSWFDLTREVEVKKGFRPARLSLPNSYGRYE
jgi:hypothetical protein